MPKKKKTKQKIRIKSVKSSRVAPEFKPKSRSKVVFIIASLLLVAAFYSSSQKSGMGGIQVTSGTDATVTINGKDVGKTPYYVENQKAGLNEIRITEVGSNLEWTEKINLVAGTLATMHQEFNTDKNKFSNHILSFDKLSDSNKSTVKITGNPSSSSVTIDGKPQGFTPIDLELAPGPHVFTFTSPGYSDKVINAALAKGYQLNIKFTMASLEQNSDNIMDLVNEFENYNNNRIESGIQPAPQDTKKPKITNEQINKIFDTYKSLIYELIKPYQVNKIDFISQKFNSDSLTGIFGNYIYQIDYKKLSDKLNDEQTNITIKNGPKILYSNSNYGERSQELYNLKTNFQNTLIVHLFSTQGFHCCSRLLPVTITNGYLNVGKSLNQGNVDIVSEDQFFTKNNNLYKVSISDALQYYKMSYAESTWMFYPLIYKIDRTGFVEATSELRDYYKELYQDSKTESSQIDNSYIDWSDSYIKTKIYTSQIYLYAIGTLAGEPREELKKDLLKYQNLKIDEDELFKIISSSMVDSMK